VVPIYVRYHGVRFCSYICGCGGLAETLGDFWRHLAPRGSTAKKAEWFSTFILVCAFLTTLLVLNDLWQVVQSSFLSNARVFAKQWYDLIVDFWMACVIGVAAYPYLGNRFWCRYMCPLRAYMQHIAKFWSKIKITSDSKCIGCGQCTRYCQMGINVQKFAQSRTDMANFNSACIQCGICIEVCPMDVLKLESSKGFSARTESK
jgi:ferredoxin-type protein NapH